MVEVKELHKKAKTPIHKEKMEESVKKLRKEYEKPVKGMFEFLDAQGGFLEFSWRYFPGDPIFTFKLRHGEICELPMGVVKHLNNTMKKVRMANATSLDDPKGLKFFEKTSRVRFTPMDVM